MEIKVTEADINGANTYVPLITKEELARDIAYECIDAVPIKASGIESLQLPAMYKENTQRKSRYLMGVFASLYLRHKFDPVEGDKWLMAADDYDRYAGSHVFNQMERMKSNSAIRDRVFDILYDYKDFERRVNAEIHSIINIQNDAASRTFIMQAAMTTPDALAKAMDELKSLQNEAEQLQRSKMAGA